MSTTEKLRTIYRAVVGEGRMDATIFDDAVDFVLEQVDPLIDSGEIQVDRRAWLRSELVRIDKADGTKVDRALAAIAMGQDSLGLDDDPLLDRVTILGGGRRKLLRYINATDLAEMDEARNANMRAALHAYHSEWKPQYQAWREVLRRNLTIGAAVENEDLPNRDALFGTAS